MSTTKKCEYCDKVGVPIMPLRYAVAPAQSSAPTATGPSVALSAKAAHYTTRLLRSGYLYVYDEARDRWESYFVTPQAMFFKLAETPGIPPVLPKKPFDCADAAHRAISSCITIRDAKNATNVWLGFSDVEWTAAVREKHSSADYRKRHMRSVKVNAYAGSTDKKYCFDIKDIGKKVAEYAMEPAKIKTDLNWSPFAIDPRKMQTARLLEESEKLAPGKGFAVVLDDPTGVAAELGVLMQHSLEVYAHADPDKLRKLAVSDAIRTIELNVRDQAWISAEVAADDRANLRGSGTAYSVPAPVAAEYAQQDAKAGIPPPKNYSEQQQQQARYYQKYQQERAGRIAQSRIVTPAQGRLAGEVEWAKYRVKVDQAALNNWRKAYDTQFKAFDAEHISPLALAHSKVMTGSELHAQFECNYDPTSPESGIVYAKTMQLCIGSTQDKAACFDVYSKWLTGSVSDKQNLLLRGMALNLDASAAKIKEALAVSLDWRGFPLDGIASSIGKATESVAHGKADALGGLIARISGPLTSLLAEATDGIVRPSLALLAVHTGKTFAVVKTTGSIRAFRSALLRELISASSIPMNESQMKRAIKAELRRLEIAGVKLDGIETKKFMVMISPEEIKEMPKGLTTQQQAEWIVKRISTVEAYQELILAKQTRWQDKLRMAGARMESAGKTGIPYVTALVAAYLQYNANQKMGEDITKAMSHEAQEANIRLMAGTAALAGTIAEAVGTSLEQMAKVVPKYGQGLRYLGEFLTVGGKYLGIGGALIMATMDFKQAYQANNEGQTGLAWAYGVSGALGMTAAWLIGSATFAGATGIGLVLVVLLFGVAYLIEIYKDNKVQDWLERCVFGIAAQADHYPNSKKEMAELKLAIPG